MQAKVEQTSKRLVAFSKRKLGHFRKASELSLLCNSDIAVVLFSQHRKVFFSGYPDPVSVIRGYLSGTFSSTLDPASVGHDWGAEPAVSSLSWEYKEAMRALDDEKKSLKAMPETPGSGCGDGSWGNRSVGEMGLEEVVEFKERVEQLRQNLVAAEEEEETTTITMALLISSLPAPMTTTTRAEKSLSMSLLNDDVVETDQARDWDWDSCIFYFMREIVNRVEGSACENGTPSPSIK